MPTLGEPPVSVMFYGALTFWLLIALLEAFAIFKLWEGVVRPRWINLVLLPGTIISETAHFLAALLTGAPVREAKLVSDESVAEGTPEKQTGIPVLSPLLLALLPILAGLAIIVALYRFFDAGLVNQMFAPPLAMQLSQSVGWELGGWMQMAHDLLDLSERLLRSLPLRDLGHTWKAWVFFYLTGCLAIRMVPLRGNLRGGMASMVLIGALAGGLGWLAPHRVNAPLRGNAWSLLGYIVAALTVLLLVAMLVRGAVALGFVLADKPQPTRK